MPIEGVTSRDGDALSREVRRAVAAEPGLTPTRLKKSLPKDSKNRAPEALDIARAMAARGELHRWSKGKKERFFDRDPVETLDRLVPALLERPLSAPELKKAVERRAPGHGDLVPEWLRSALARRIVHPAATPPRTRGKRFGREPDPRLLLAKPIAALRKILPQLDALGIDRARAASVLAEELGVDSDPVRPPADERHAFLDSLADLARREPEGSLLSVRALRQRVAMDKSRFDAVALALAAEGLVVLHHHDYPSSLPDSERQQLIEDARGTHYVGIAPRSHR